MTTYRQLGKGGRPRVYLWTEDSDSSKIDIGPDVLSFRCAKSITSPVGQWSITLLPRVSDDRPMSDVRSLTKLYRSDLLNRLVSIGYDTDGGIMAGLVGSVTDSFAVASNGNVTRALVITGQDMGKVLVRDNVVSVIAAANVPEQLGYRQAVVDALGEDAPMLQYIRTPVDEGDPERSGYFEGKGIAELATWALSSLTSMRIPVLAAAAGGKGIAGDYITPLVIAHREDVLWTKTSEMGTYQGNAWSFFQSMIDPDFYECWVDSVPIGGQQIPRMYLIIRPKPFDEPLFGYLPTGDDDVADWGSLNTMVEGRENHDIELDEVFAANLSLSEDDALSHYQVFSSHVPLGLDSAATSALAYPVTDFYNMKRFGMRQFRADLNLAGGDLEAFAETIGGEVTKFRNRAFNWYRANPWFEGGSITVRGRDEFRVGDPVRLPWRAAPLGDEVGMRYYCPQVTWSWSIGGRYECTLQLTRGHNSTMMAEVWGILQEGGAASAPENFAAM